ncbi:MAG TPA: aldehyde-activating protein [Gammaproteobacteria bacterium]|nr:aldehyde-activating protein [Gammaproteobacteria bacterium]
MNVLKGSCLCSEVTFSVEERFKAFYLCHCAQCQKLTGSGFASNILTTPDNINWLTGAEHITNYEHPSRAFSKAFCKLCGSGVPFINKSKTTLFIPAGSLTEKPSIVPTAKIFKAESPEWLKQGLNAKSYDGFPD